MNMMSFVGVTLGFLCCTAPALPAAESVVISEFMAANAGNFVDEDGDSSDWLEIHNPGPAAANLTGWSLTDDLAAPAKWRFPAISLAPGQYKVVWASGKNRTNGAAPLHTSFRLDRGGGDLALHDAMTNLVSAFAGYPSQYISASYGRAATTGNIGYFASPTPGTANTTALLGRTDAPAFSHRRGFYDTNFSLQLTSATAGATIYFTTNGTPPAPTNGVAYGGPLAISRTTVIRAASFAPGLLPSEARTHSFLFTRDVIRQPDRVPPPGWPATWGANVVDYGMDTNVVNDPRYSGTIETDLRAMPSLCLVMDLKDLFDATRGIYANAREDGILWERPTSLELIYPDGRDGFQENAGLRIRGGFSRASDDPKHSFRLFFREEYGAGRLEYPMFGPTGATSFDKFDLRCTQDDSWAYTGSVSGTFMPDTFARDTQLALGQPATRGFFYHLYINGVYWGEYNTEERPEASFAASYFGGVPEDYDVVRIEYGPFDVTPADGDLNAWRRLWQAATNGFASDAAYERVQGNNPDGTPNPAYEVLVDLDNLIDYMLLTIYVGNFDGPVYQNSFPNNFFASRNRTTREGFRFFTHDAELSLSDVNFDRTSLITVGDPAAGSAFSESNPQYVWQRFWTNAEFRIRAADHVQKHFFNGGALTPAACLARYAARTNELSRGMVGESARWGDSKREPPILRDNWIAAVGRIMTNYLPFRSGVVLQQLRNRRLFPSLAAPLFSHGDGEVPNGYLLELSHTNLTGVIYFTTDGSDPRRRGGAVSVAARSYAEPLIVNEPLFVRARVLSGTNWSALVQAVLYPPQDLRRLLITEIMYNPPALGLVDGDEYEFLEFKNIGTNALSLTGLRLVSGITFAFTNGTTLGPGQFFVIARNPDRFAEKYPGVEVRGSYSGRLDNSGETVRLVQGLDTTLLAVTYDDRAPWPVTSDGHGFSLVSANPNGNSAPDDPRSWRGSAGPGGSPGADDPPLMVPGVLINEALTASVLPEVDAIELFNPTASPVDLGGWFLTDDPAMPKKFRIPDGTQIGAGEFVLFDETQFNPVPGSGLNNSFSLRAEGDEIYLFSADAAGQLTGYGHGFEFGAAERGVSLGRYRLSTGEDDFTAQLSLSLGSANPGPRIGPVVINEVHYHPELGEDEFIELRNISANPVPMFDVEVPTNTWRLNGLGYDLPQGMTMAPDALLLIVSTSPTAFRAKYAVPSGVAILGPFAGQLQDSGERLELQKPGPLDTNGRIAYITVDAVRYNDKAPWPAVADGSGPSLQRRESFSYGNDPINWEGARPTPGRNFVPGPIPVITAQPASVVVVATREATFTVGASGPVPLGYQWRHEGHALPNATSATLLLTNLQFSQGGQYSVIVYNEFGSSESAPALLTILTPANILTQPTNRSVKIRPDPTAAPQTNVTFTIVANSTTPVRLQWRFNGANIAGATNTTLTVTNVQLTHEGRYDVAVTDGAGTVFSAAAYLQPLITPTFLRSPESQEAVAGGAVTLSAVVGGHPPPFTYEWRRGTIVLVTNVTPSSNAFFSLLAPEAGTSAVYRVVVKNLANSAPGVISGAATITALADADGDGLPDVWESANGLAGNDPADAGADLDQDGLTNAEEYLAGTNPNDNSSYLKIDSLTLAGAATITFATVARRTYALEFAESLQAGPGSWHVLAEFPARTTNAVESIADSRYNLRRFYRLATPRGP
jgi:hypothetical protein